MGRDVVVVLSLRDQTFYDHSYILGFPVAGLWLKVFNSDVYDNFPNSWVQGNGGGIIADGPPKHGMAQSAGITLPADSLLVFARDHPASVI